MLIGAATVIDNDVAIPHKQPALTRVAPEQLFAAGEPIYGYFDGPVKQLNSASSKPVHQSPSIVSWSTQSSRQLEMVMLQHQQFQLLCRISTSQAIPQIVLFDHLKQQAKRIAPRRFFKRRHWSANGCDGVSSVGELTLSKSRGLWQLALAGRSTKLPLTVNTELRPAPLSLPISCCGALTPHGWVYQQQHHGLVPIGEMKLHYEPQVLARMTAGYSYFSGETSRKVPWRWLMFNGEIAGQKAGLSLTDGLSATFPGNGFWLDGARHILPAVQLTIAPSARHSGQWRIVSACGRIEGIFSPNIAVKSPTERWLSAQAQQLFSGRLDVNLTDTAGVTHHIRNMPAIAGCER
ncbi:DUF2804 family protein [Shewanella avicenniae]|uniref:DUF2804 family protein n=1 Tax=Shewanella avicenniae TaxID=2814294 RepID=A0ABX7QUM8_9GAMM|nr:DUF2804 family protein [Shewanella avicenniae]QSX34631.1 DUF2804 family protein [Shewanella avicenniae]